MKIKPLLICLAMTALVTLSTGCTSPATTGSNQVTGTVTGLPEVQQQRVTIDGELEKVLQISDIKARRLDGFLQVQVTLRSLAAETLPLETKFEWFDRDGFKIDNTAELWRPSQISGGATSEISAMAPKAESETFRFQVRRANPIVRAE